MASTYSVKRSKEDGVISWLVLDADRDVVDKFDSSEEAGDECDRLNNEAEKESLIEAIDLEELTVEQLRQVVKMMAGE